MSITNLGNQSIFFNFKFLAKAKEFNKTIHDVIPKGIYKGGTLTHLGGNLVKLSTFSALLNIDSEKSVTIQTQEDISFESQMIETLPYVCINYVWKNAIDNYIDFEFKATISAYDICFGKAEFTGGVITGFDYTYRTRGLYNFDDDTIYSNTTYAKQTLTPQSGLIYGLNLEYSNPSGILNPKISYTPEEDNQAVSKEYIDDILNSNPITQSGIVDDYILSNIALFQDYFFTNLGATKDISYTITMSDNSNEVITNITTYDYNVVIDNTIEGGDDHSIENESGLVPTYHSLNVYSIDQDNFVLESFFQERDFTQTVLPIGYFITGNYGLNIDWNDEFNGSLNTWTTRSVLTSKSMAGSFGYNSKIYIVGGNYNPYYTDGNYIYSNNDEYSFFRQSWVAKTAMNYSVFVMLAGIIRDEGIGYVFGGDHYTGLSQVSSNINEAYTVNSDSWASKISGSSGREQFTYGDNLYNFISSGFGSTYSNTDNAWTSITPPSTARWSFFPDGGSNRAYYHNGSFAYNNKGYLVGGENYSGAAVIINNVDEYDITGDSWSSKLTMPTKRRRSVGFTITDSTSSRGYIVSGEDTTSLLSSVNNYNFDSNTWGTGTSVGWSRSFASGDSV